MQDWARRQRGAVRAPPAGSQKRYGSADEPVSREPALPTGTFTFLFTDVEGSARAWLQNAEGMSAALARHDALIERLVAEHCGQVVRPRGEGDSRFAVFARASDGVSAACAIQLTLIKESWPLQEPLRVRMAVHTGEADLRLGDYYGPAVNHCARLRAVASGGQVLVSAMTADLLGESLPARVQLRDLGLHQLKDLEQPERIWQLMHPDLQAEFSPLGSVTRRRHNLPSQLSSFVGRDHAVAELRSLVARTRLLTLTGPGGIGKTRLALRVASESVANYLDGIWLVRLEAVTDPELVTAAVAAVLNVRELSGRSLRESMIDAIGSRELLLVLDNCEHLVQPCAELAEALLGACSGLRLLTTSREALRMTSEVVWRVPTLSVTEAAQLFVERAGAADSSFSSSVSHSAAVEQVCQRLDGIPLALELAAARVQVLTLSQIAERLDDRFRLLSSGNRTALPRHQTLRAMVDWSYDLLTDMEKALFRRLSVFAGGWTLETAEAVGAAEPVQRSDVLDLLSGLVDKSLVLAEEQRQGQKRYRLLETLRQYGAERLEGSAEVSVLRARHASHYLTLVTEANLQLGDRRQAQALQQLEAEHDNVRAALSWCVEHGELEQAMRFGSALWRFWQLRGYLREGRERLTELLTLSGPGTPARLQSLRPAVLYGAGFLARYQGDYSASRSFCEEGLSLSRELGDRRWTAMALNNLATLAKYRGEYTLASSLYEESLAIRRELGDYWLIAETLNNMGILTKDRGDYAMARSLLQESLAIKQQRGDIWGMAMSLNKLGDVAFCEGDYTQARSLQEQSLALYRETGDRWQIAETLNTLGNAALGQGEVAAARSACYASLEMKRDVGDRRGIAMSLNSLGDAAEFDGDYVAARELYEQSLRISWQLGDGERIPESLEGLARVAAGQGLVGRALRLVGTAAKLRRAVGTPLSAAEQEMLARKLEPARQTFTEEERQVAWAEGQSMSVEQAVAYALESVDPAPAEP